MHLYDHTNTTGAAACQKICACIVQRSTNRKRNEGCYYLQSWTFGRGRQRVASTCIFTKHEAVQKADFQSSQDGGFHEYSGVCCELVKDVHVFFDISKEQALQNTAVILYSTCAVQWLTKQLYIRPRTNIWTITFGQTVSHLQTFAILCGPTVTYSTCYIDLYVGR